MPEPGVLVTLERVLDTTVETLAERFQRFADRHVMVHKMTTHLVVTLRCPHCAEVICVPFLVIERAAGHGVDPIPCYSCSGLVRVEYGEL